MKSAIRDHLYLLFVPAFGLLIAIGFMARESARQEIKTEEWVRHTSEVLSHSTNLLLALVSAETARDNFVLTKSADFSATTLDNIEQARRELDRLEELTSDNVAQQERIKQLRAAAVPRTELLLQHIALRESKSVDALVEIIKQSPGARLMLDIRRIMNGIQEEERNRLQERTRLVEVTESRTRRLISTSSVLGVLLLAVATGALFRELSMRRKALADLEIANRATVEAFSARAMFLANMSHEIRTPLHSIVGMSDVLSTCTEEVERQKCITIIHRAGNLLMNLVNDILDLSKVEAGKLEVMHVDYDLKPLIEQTVTLIAFRASQKGLELSHSIDPDAPARLNGDPNRVRQILLNLLGNAIKFTPKGSISLDVEYRNQEPNGPVLRFIVSDTGIGIPESRRTSVFEKFNQIGTNISYGSTGLGLTISKQLVEMLGGRIWFESTLGAGSIFRFDLPATPAQSTPSFNSSQDPLADRRQLKILVADDVEENRLLVQLYLRNLPYILEFARDGQETVALAKKTDFNLILMDMHMPIVNGYEAVKTIREMERDQGRPRAPIVALTAYALQEEADKSLAAGCDHHLKKPVTREVLRKSVFMMASQAPLATENSAPRIYLNRNMEPLLPNFIDNRIKELAELSVALEAGDKVAIERLVHLLKGVSSTFGFQRLAELGKKIGETSVAGSFDQAKKHLEQAQKYLDQVEVVFV